MHVMGFPFSCSPFPASTYRDLYWETQGEKKGGRGGVEGGKVASIIISL